MISAGSGIRPRPCSPREASAPSPGSSTSTPRSRSSATFAWVAASAHIRSFIAGATIRGAVQARKEVVSKESQMPAASLAIVFAEAGATTKASAPSTTARWEIGSCSGARVRPGIGAAHRVAGELVRQHGRADDSLERGGADEPLGGRGHRDANPVAGERREARELDRLVGGDSTTHTDQDSCHLASVRSGAAKPGRLREQARRIAGC